MCRLNAEMFGGGDNVFPEMDVSLDLMPAFYNKHLGVTFGEAYYFDIDHREKVEKEKKGLLQDILGQYIDCSTGIAGSVLFIQPVDLILHTQGAEWIFPEDATLVSSGTPWGSLRLGEIGRIDPQDAAHHPVIERILKHYAELVHRYSDSADILLLRWGLLNIHTPYTTAQQLYGQDIFSLMMDCPANADLIFNKIWEIYQAVFNRLAAAIGVALRKVQLGDCAASMLSPALYSNVVAPVNAKIARQYSSAGYHSCGPSTHLLDAFAQVAHFENIQLGHGTDLEKAASHFSNTRLEPLLDPILMRNATPDSVAEAVYDIAKKCRKAASVKLCAWSCDRDTPIENLCSMYEAVQSLKKRNGSSNL